MKSNRLLFALPCLLLAAVLWSAGCTQQSGQDGKESKGDQKVAQKDNDHNGDKKDAKGEDHGWWCQEHGVPEDICSLCAAEEKVKEFKAKGDWCEKHDRAKSQCFKCDPMLYDRFAAMYRAKYGKEPRRPDQKEFQD
jgi:hypothetical protein